MSTIGILYIYIVGAEICWQWLALASLIPVAIFATGMFFCPESPAFLVTVHKDTEARKALRTLRGKHNFMFVLTYVYHLSFCNDNATFYRHDISTC